MTANVGFIRGDARSLPLADASVDLIVTSPPYFGLRSYTDGGEHYAGQVGAEPTPREFIDALIDCTREMARVLRPSGSIFLNLGDKYSGAQGQTQTGINGRRHMTNSADTWRQTDPRRTGIPNKSLMLLPERYRIAAVDELGLIARAVIIWSKLNGLPESVKDRVRRSHEDWVHLTKSPKYYAAVDEIRVAYATRYQNRVEEYGERHGEGTARVYAPGDRRDAANASGILGLFTGLNPLGKLPGSVWEIATQPLKVPAELGVDHFAAFPMEWPRRLILGWSPREVCTACGEGRRPVTVRSSDGRPRSTTAAKDPSWQAINRADWQENVTRTITGYACACPDTSAPSTPGIVLDPFGGTGTTALVATMLGRTGITVDLSADYQRIATWRSSDPKERARAAGIEPDAVAKIIRPVVDQFDLFGDVS